jgi:sarcosine oxidase
VTGDYDVIVVGLGALGSAAAWVLARAGAGVLGLEQFELGHHRGASHDHARIIRRSCSRPTPPSPPPLPVEPGGLRRPV